MSNNKNVTLLDKYNEVQANIKSSKDFAKSVRRVVHEENNVVTDATTGQILSETTTQRFTSSGGEPPFIKLYLDDLILLNDLPSSTSSILWEIVSGLRYDNQIILNSSLKKRICSKLDIKMQTLNNALTKFVKKQILYRLEPGIFLPNPYLFAKGGWPENKQLRMIIDYKPNGEKHIHTEVADEVAADIKAQ